MNAASVNEGTRRANGRDQRSSFRWLFWLLGVLLVVLAAAEFTARVVVTKISRVEGRTVREYRGIYHPAPQRPMMLFVGNSLLEAAIDFPALSRSLQPRADARRFFVDNTAYYDWYYGLRRIFAEGARPKTVAIMMSDMQFTKHTIRGEYSALRLFRTNDIFEIAERLHMHPTEATGLLAGNLSAFYGLRSELRKVVLGRLMPGMADLILLVVRRGEKPLPDAEFYPIARGRMRELRALCEANGATLLLLPPPLPLDGSERLIRVAQEERVELLRPFNGNEFQPAHFRDGFHVNQEGQALYTSRLVPELSKRIPLLVR